MSERGAPAERFDAEYYRRWYRGARPVHTRAQVAHLAVGVLGFAGWWGLPVRSVLDLGAGVGWWRDWFAAHRPGVRYRSVDASAYACRRYDHEQADLATFDPGRTYDLVVCQGVLQYLDDAGAASAIAMIGRATKGLCYLEVPTATDRDHALDTAGSDLDAAFRPGSWYRRHLEAAGLRPAGAGLWVARSSGLVLYELEAPPPASARRASR